MKSDVNNYLETEPTTFDRDSQVVREFKAKHEAQPHETVARHGRDSGDVSVFRGRDTRARQTQREPEVTELTARHEAEIRQLTTQFEQAATAAAASHER